MNTENGRSKWAIVFCGISFVLGGVASVPMGILLVLVGLVISYLHDDYLEHNAVYLFRFIDFASIWLGTLIFYFIFWMPFNLISIVDSRTEWAMNLFEIFGGASAMAVFFRGLLLIAEISGAFLAFLFDFCTGTVKSRQNFHFRENQTETYYTHVNYSACAKCGKPVNSDTEICSDCEHGQQSFHDVYMDCAPVNQRGRAN